MTKKEIGQTLKKLREGCGMSREEVAAILDKSSKTIGHWESGYAMPDANMLFLLCSIYEADINEAFGFGPSEDEKELSSDEFSHIKKYRVLDTHGKKVVDTALDLEYDRMTHIESREEKGWITYINLYDLAARENPWGIRTTRPASRSPRSGCRKTPTAACGSTGTAWSPPTRTGTLCSFSAWKMAACGKGKWGSSP